MSIWVRFILLPPKAEDHVVGHHEGEHDEDEIQHCGVLVECDFNITYYRSDVKGSEDEEPIPTAEGVHVVLREIRQILLLPRGPLIQIVFRDGPLIPVLLPLGGVNQEPIASRGVVYIVTRLGHLCLSVSVECNITLCQRNTRGGHALLQLDKGATF